MNDIEELEMEMAKSFTTTQYTELAHLMAKRIERMSLIEQVCNERLSKVINILGENLSQEE